MSPPGGRPRPLWLLCATGTEAAAARRGLALGGSAAREVVVMQLGMGAARAGPPLAAALARGQAGRLPLPHAVVSFGLAGSGDDAQPRGSWATCSRLQAHGRPTLVPSQPLASCVGAAAAGRCSQRSWRQVAEPTPGAGERGDRGTCWDMESHTWATLAREAGVDWGVMRLISDAPATPLPGPIVAWGGGARGAAVAAALAQPRQLWSFGRAMRQLCRQLVEAAAQIAGA